MRRAFIMRINDALMIHIEDNAVDRDAFTVPDIAGLRLAQRLTVRVISGNDLSHRFKQELDVKYSRICFDQRIIRCRIISKRYIFTRAFDPDTGISALILASDIIGGQLELRTSARCTMPVIVLRVEGRDHITFCIQDIAVIDIRNTNIIHCDCLGIAAVRIDQPVRLLIVSAVSDLNIGVRHCVVRNI